MAEVQELPNVPARRVGGTDLLVGLLWTWLAIAVVLGFWGAVGFNDAGGFVVGAVIGTVYWVPGAAAWLVSTWAIEPWLVRGVGLVRMLWPYVVVGALIGMGYSLVASSSIRVIAVALGVVVSVVARLLAERRSRRRHDRRPRWADKFVF
ncbi:hypothetical protein [Phytoactinopolyspora mesophila]|uniref:DUF3054 family protein n=1 Tax=Phytoactinopolyspora mesophila TaxID=2650750 RepID=A0A7K3MC58_9ACTN|nr:hypothetical protein [Phytoactinopolyspora mesophila]NDL60905.1 hypothetical protein [Phytoactinopolyspora mesophila]